MPTALGPRFPGNFAGTPPRMSVQDLEIWRRWRPTVERGALAIYFDVGLGLPGELPESDDAAQVAGWIRNTQKRADVIIERADQVSLVELRFNAQSSAIGRLLTYQQLLIDDNPFRRRVVPYLVTNNFDSEVRRIAQGLGILYEVA